MDAIRYHIDRRADQVPFIIASERTCSNKTMDFDSDFQTVAIFSHQGFAYSFETVKEDIFLSTANPVSQHTLHCNTGMVPVRASEKSKKGSQEGRIAIKNSWAFALKSYFWMKKESIRLARCQF